LIASFLSSRNGRPSLNNSYISVGKKIYSEAVDVYKGIKAPSKLMMMKQQQLNVLQQQQRRSERYRVLNLAIDRLQQLNYQSWMKTKIYMLLMMNVLRMKFPSVM
jgi:hypothetical protein